jgi:PIN domain nuclease of toxin-antitoxin system
MHRYLIDSHVYVWLLNDPSQISASTLDEIAAEDSVLYVSYVSLWELSLKSLKGGLVYSVEDIVGSVGSVGARELELKTSHMIAQTKINMEHRDPFDRLICAQALVEDLILVTADVELLKLTSIKTLCA